MKKPFLIIVLSLCIVVSCKKEGSNASLTQEIDVYVAGWVIDTITTYSIDIHPTYWKNGKSFRLNFDYFIQRGRANSIAVSGNDIYVAGYRDQDIYLGGGYTQGLYWKNGAVSENPGSYVGYNQLDHLVISNNDVYMIVDEYLHVGNVAQYLKNGNIVKLGLGGGPDGSIAAAIAVSGEDVYVAGAAIKVSDVPGPTVIGAAKYWKNGIPVDLTDGTVNAFATEIALSGNDVYIAGWVLNENPDNGNAISRAIYWKNGTPFYLSDGTTDISINSLTVSGNDVYMAGTQNDGVADTNGFRKTVAKYWKNGIAVNLTDGLNYAEATSIAISGNDIYVAGLEYDGKLIDGFPASVAKYWKNGEPVLLTDGSSDAGANSIFVATYY
jgi:hypothetical protein